MKTESATPVLSSDLAKHPVDVVLDGLLGQIQMQGDLFVDLALVNRPSQLLPTESTAARVG
jgi:hypothetical protein